MSTTTLQRGDLTPRPLGDQAYTLSPFRSDDPHEGRVVVHPVDDIPLSSLTDNTWVRTVDTLSGRTIELRRGPCGAGCRCGAEVRVVE